MTGRRRAVVLALPVNDASGRGDLATLEQALAHHPTSGLAFRTLYTITCSFKPNGASFNLSREDDGSIKLRPANPEHGNYNQQWQFNPVL